MTASACPALPRNNHEFNPIAVESQAIPTGTFTLRRAHYLNKIEHELLLSAEQRQALVSLIKEGDLDAKQKVIAHNLRLVAGIAMRYVNRGVEFLDLVNEGIVGLIHALEKFDLEGSFRFSVYARWCIRENIERAIFSRINCHPN